jgi:hypothetical protein
MKQKQLYIFALIITSATFTPSQIAAQSINSQYVPPDNPADLVDQGGFVYTSADLSLGPSKEGGISYIQTFYENSIPSAVLEYGSSGWHDNIMSGLIASHEINFVGNFVFAKISVTLRGETETFGRKRDIDALVNALAFSPSALPTGYSYPVTIMGSKGGRLTFPGFNLSPVYTTKYGAIATFAPMNNVDTTNTGIPFISGGENRTAQPLSLQSLNMPNGETLTYAYDNSSYCWTVEINSPTKWKCGATAPIYRLKSVFSNYGYRLDYGYKSDSNPSYPSGFTLFDDYQVNLERWTKQTSLTAVNAGYNTPLLLYSYKNVCETRWPIVLYNLVATLFDGGSAWSITASDGTTTDFEMATIWSGAISDADPSRSALFSITRPQAILPYINLAYDPLDATLKSVSTIDGVTSFNYNLQHPPSVVTKTNPLGGGIV